MIYKLIDEIEVALENNLYFVALNTALTLPDICGRAEYPQLKSKTAERYKKWYHEYVGQYEQCPVDKDNKIGMPYLSAEVVYSLRCALLHQGNPNVEKEKTGIDTFVLCVEKKNEFGIYADSASVIKNVQREQREYRVNVRRLCLILCRVAENYYEKNKSKFDFFNYHLEDVDQRKAYLREKAKEIEKEEEEMKALSNSFRRK